MFDRKKLNREKTEIYLLHLLLAYRRHFLLSGIFLLICSAAMLRISPLSGMVIITLAAFLLILSVSYRAVLFMARFGAWAGSVFGKED